MHFVSSLAWSSLGQHFTDSLLVMTGMKWVWSTHDVILFESSLAWGVFHHHVFKRFESSLALNDYAHVERHFLSSLTLDVFGQHMLICILCPY